MPLKNYGVLKCKVVDRKLDGGSTPHYQVLVSDGKTQHRIAINVKSKESPSELLYFIDDNFNHPIIKGLVELENGFTHIERQPNGLALDFIRSNFFDTKKMKPLPHNVPGPDNDLNELIGLYIERALNSQDAAVYAFGEKWGPEDKIKDQYFDFIPGNGIHDIHMNQGNAGRFAKDNGTWQDGALLIHYPSRQQWVGIFLAFQSQVFHTDDSTGDRIEKQILAVSAGVRIIAAMINPLTQDQPQTVILINSSADILDLSGWSLMNQTKRKFPLNGSINPGETSQITLDANINLANEGGIITLLDNQGLKVHGVAYTKEDTTQQGWTAVFD